MNGTFHQDGRGVHADERVAINLVNKTAAAPSGDAFDNVAVYVTRLRLGCENDRLWSVDLDTEHREDSLKKTNFS